MRTQEERDEQTLDIVSTLLGGLLLFGPPVVVLGVLVSALDWDDQSAGALVLAVFGGYVVFVVLRLSRMSPWSASSSRASARRSTPTPSSPPRRP
jgi:hypothetical protein